MDNQQVKQHVLTAWEYTYLHDDWLNPLSEALDGVSVDDALWRPGPNTKSIWEIVLHMAVWTENILERMRTGERARPEEGPWPALPEDPNQATWESAKARLWQSIENLRQEIDAGPPELIMAGPWGLSDLLCRFIHNAYHIGQITKMRECMAVVRAMEHQSELSH